MFANFKYLISEGYLKVSANSFSKKKDEPKYSQEFIERLANVKKGDKLSVQSIEIKRVRHRLLRDITQDPLS